MTVRSQNNDSSDRNVSAARLREPICDVPETLRQRNRWINWRAVDEGGAKPRKIPCRVDGGGVSWTEPSKWLSFEDAVAAVEANAELSLGFVLGDGVTGVDMDDCLSEDGVLSGEGQALLDELGSYAEVSPSGTGIKAFVLGEATKNVSQPNVEGCGKLELFSGSRWFALTGEHWAGTPTELADAQPTLDRLQRTYGTSPTKYSKESWPDRESVSDDKMARLKADIETYPEAISGQNGSNGTIAAFCEIVRLGLNQEDSRALADHYNTTRAFPPWSDPEVERKLRDACRMASPERRTTAAEDFGVVGGDAGPEHSQPSSEFRFELVDDADFATMTFEQNFLIDKLVVENQHLVVGGDQKTFKTSVLIDLAVSLAYGKPALGHFDVPSAANVLVISAESGAATIQNLVRNQRAAKGIEAESGHLHWCFQAPNLSDEEQRRALDQAIAETEARFVVLDPAYLCLGVDDEGSNIYKMGNLLRPLGEIATKHKATLAIVHHNTKASAKRSGSPTLGDLQHSGLPQFCRQWLMLSHRKPFSQGKAELRLTAGGSAGHSHEADLMIDQGQQHEGQPGRSRWEVVVTDKDTADEFSGDSAKTTNLERKILEAAALLQVSKGQREFTANTMVERRLGSGRDVRQACETLVEAGKLTKREQGNIVHYALNDEGALQPRGDYSLN